jgi:hypothetical protein
LLLDVSKVATAAFLAERSAFLSAIGSRSLI